MRKYNIQINSKTVIKKTEFKLRLKNSKLKTMTENNASMGNKTIIEK